MLSSVGVVTSSFDIWLPSSTAIAVRRERWIWAWISTCLGAGSVGQQLVHSLIVSGMEESLGNVKDCFALSFSSANLVRARPYVPFSGSSIAGGWSYKPLSSPYGAQLPSYWYLALCSHMSPVGVIPGGWGTKSQVRIYMQRHAAPLSWSGATLGTNLSLRTTVVHN